MADNSIPTIIPPPNEMDHLGEVSIGMQSTVIAPTDDQEALAPAGMNEVDVNSTSASPIVSVALLCRNHAVSNLGPAQSNNAICFLLVES